MVNAIVLREPLARLESHYKHLLRMGHESSIVWKGKNFYRLKNGTGGFDVHYMTATFDIVSDNYVTRSLAGHGFYAWGPNSTLYPGSPSLAKHPEAWTKIYPIARASLHSFDWVMLLSTGQPDDVANRHLILKYGWGIENATLGNPNPSQHQTRTSQLSDPEFSRKLNELDYKLWEEAVELNRLDIVSIKRMMPYYQAALEKAKADKARDRSNAKCCGRICRKTSR